MASAAGMEGMLVMLHTQNAASGGEDGAATSEVISLCACRNEADLQKLCDFTAPTVHLSCVSRSWSQRRTKLSLRRIV